MRRLRKQQWGHKCPAPLLLVLGTAWVHIQTREFQDGDLGQVTQALIFYFCVSTIGEGAVTDLSTEPGTERTITGVVGIPSNR